MESIKGTVLETIFRNDENGYTVAIMETDTEIITITGVFAMDISSETLEIFGNRVKHPKYGEQFQVDIYNTVLPTTVEQIEKYLSSGLIKGIGKSTAKKIVELFGEETFEIIQKHPLRLCEIEGIGEIKSELISKSFAEVVDIKEIMIFLQNHDISTNFSVKIYKQYGKDTISTITQNPYKLNEDIYGIGFKLADKIASKLGVEMHSPYRISSGVKYVLMDFASQGNSYMPYEKLLESSAQLLQVSASYIEDEIRNMAFTSKLHIENIEGERVVYYIPYYMAEANVCNKLISLSQQSFSTTKQEALDLFLQTQETLEINLTDIQKNAVVESIINGVTVITGGPGTGKTTIIKSIIKIFQNMKKKVFLCAPTGRAAKRITESTGEEAKTIHRLLEYAYGEDDSNISFNRNEDCPLECDVVIVDEVSMVDILLMNNLLKSIKRGTHLIIVGDVDQLPSVGAGNVLLDIISSNAIKTIRLDTIFRQSIGSMIVENAHLINKGLMPICNKKDSDFYFIQKNIDDIKDVIVELYTSRLPLKYNLDPIKDIHVLSPMKKGDVGVVELNKKLQAAINPPSKLKKEKTYGSYIFRMGDKVMQIRNNYEVSWKQNCSDGSIMDGEGIFNGDIGIIVFIDDIEQELVIQFDDNKEVVYPFSQLDELMLAYATTVHKSQGSEFAVIIMPMVWGPPMLLSRNLLYTAITRAKTLVVLVGIEKYMKDMINNNKIDKRYSALDSRLKSTIESYLILSGGIDESIR